MRRQLGRQVFARRRSSSARLVRTRVGRARDVRANPPTVVARRATRLAKPIDAGQVGRTHPRIWRRTPAAAALRGQRAGDKSKKAGDDRRGSTEAWCRHVPILCTICRPAEPTVAIARLSRDQLSDVRRDIGVEAPQSRRPAPEDEIRLHHTEAARRNRSTGVDVQAGAGRRVDVGDAGVDLRLRADHACPAVSTATGRHSRVDAI
jgi:hypothetical protein